MAINLTDISFTERAERAADLAAARAGVLVHVLSEQHEIDAAERLLSEIWSINGQVVVPANLMKAMLHSGNYVSGALADGQLVGTSIGFLGRRKGSLHLHSHITGVSPALQGRHVGFALKQHQRAWALRNGLEEIVWTFDPLVRRNGYFNITKLGAEIVDYKANFYGEMRDDINADDDSDRCVVLWRLASDRAADASEGRGGAQIASEAAIVVLSQNAEGGPSPSLELGELLFAQIPDDIVSLRRSNKDQAAQWRQALREVFEWAFAEKYRVTGMTKDGGYLLSRS
ncbi:MAG: GNAT family N-acetyltransferase [Actinomycetota bacterium]